MFVPVAEIAAFEQAIEKAKAVDGLHWTPKAADVLDTLERAAKAGAFTIKSER